MALWQLIEKKPEYASENVPMQKYPLTKPESDALIADQLSPSMLAISVAAIQNNERSLLYSVNVVSPPNIERFIGSEQLPAGLPADARRQFGTGYFYNEEIQRCNPSDFQNALYAIAKHATEIEVAARPDDSSPMVRNRVRITQTS